ncbi:hypothetical protein GR11A_00157 [Vibrio phage vB_VcorM_GR11A]|nr:hypothetical protein GR11A_00157 [Vibrio phage vB_VcorM_GR11A]
MHVIDKLSNLPDILAGIDAVPEHSIKQKEHSGIVEAYRLTNEDIELLDKVAHSFEVSVTRGGDLRLKPLSTVKSFKVYDTKDSKVFKILRNAIESNTVLNIGLWTNVNEDYTELCAPTTDHLIESFNMEGMSGHDAARTYIVKLRHVDIVGN